MKAGRRQSLGSKGVRAAQRERLEKVVLVFASLLIVVLLLAWLSGYKQVRISDVTVSGMDTIESVHVITHVEDAIFGKYLGLYPRNNYFLVQTRDLEALLLESYPKIREVDVSRESFTELSVELVEREPYAEWCSEGTCHHVDESGLMYGPKLMTDKELLHFYGQSSSTLPYYGNATSTGVVAYPLQFLPEERILELQGFIDELAENLIHTDSLTITPDEHYDLALSGGGYVRFYPDHDLTVLGKDLVIAFHKKISTESKQATLEYIDARFANKIIFKFEGEVLE